jgi:hypothetical protein
MFQQDHWRRSVLLVAAMLVAVGTVLCGNDTPDPRVLSIHYWQTFIDRGIVQGNPETAVAPAEYTRTKSPAPSMVPNDPDILIISATNTTQSETSVFVNPNDNNKALNSNNSTNWPFSTLYGTSHFHTTDGGATWPGAVTAPAGSNWGDPATGISLGGIYYIGYITTSFGQGVARSTNEGTSWTGAVLGSGGTLDKNHLWVDNSATSAHEGNVYSSWTTFSSPYGAIEVMRSTNDGVSWVNRIAVSAGVAAGSHNQGVNLQTGPDGTLYVAWAGYDQFTSGNYDEDFVGFCKSTNGGVSYTTATRIHNYLGIRGQGTNLGGPYPIRVASFPVMAVDITGGSRNGYIYIVFTNRVSTANGSWDNYLIRSTDGGTTWSARILVGTEPSATSKKEFYPWITCDPVTGNLSCGYYSNRNSGTNAVEYWVSNSTDGGDTWEDSQISDVMFTPAPIPGLASGYMGDYTGISARDGRVYPVWMDNRATPVRAYTQPYDFEGGGGGGIPCGDIASFVARCQAGGTVQARITMTGLTHVGETVEFMIDGVAYPATIVTNGVGARAQISVGGFGAGSHTVELTDPDGCFADIVVTCPSAGKADVGWDDEDAPAATALLGNHPNPFNPSTTIKYAVNEDSWVTLKIYNTLGQEIATLVDAFQTTGVKSVNWNGRNEAGSPVTSGIYIYRLTTGSVVQSEKMMLMK